MMIPYADNGDFAVTDESGPLRNLASRFMRGVPRMHTLRSGEQIRADDSGYTHELRGIRIRRDTVYAMLVSVFDSAVFIGGAMDYLIREADHLGYSVRGFSMTGPVVDDNHRPDCDMYRPEDERRAANSRPTSDRPTSGNQLGS